MDSTLSPTKKVDRVDQKKVRDLDDQTVNYLKEIFALFE